MNQIDTPSITSLESFSHNFERYGDYLYFERNDKRKPSCYENILALAKKRIVIIDPFFSVDEDPELFEKVKSEDIDIKILTKCDLKQGKDKVKAYFDTINAKLKKNNLNYKFCVHCFVYSPKKSVRISMYRYSTEKIYVWHDRFLLVDNRAFLVGSSMNNQVSGEKSFGIYEMKDDGELVDFILKLYERYVNLLDNRKNGWYFST